MSVLSEPFSDGLVASRIPALPRDSHVRSHAAIPKNNLCDSHAHLLARAIAGGWTRTPSGRLRRSASVQAIQCIVVPAAAVTNLTGTMV